MTTPRLLLLHPAGVEPSAFAKLVGPLPFDCVYPRAANGSRWDHLGESADVAALMGIEADYIMGFSAGAFMCARMLESKTYRGAMMVAGGFIKALRPRPTPLMLVNGTLDTRVPYGGSEHVLGAQETALKMAGLLGVADVHSRVNLPNKNADGCRATLDMWGESADVNLYTIVNGGHVWPGSPLNPPSLGRVCYDISATKEMCEFFGSLL